MHNHAGKVKGTNREVIEMRKRILLNAEKNSQNNCLEDVKSILCGGSHLGRLARANDHKNDKSR
jgi:hypothetical protein